MAERPEKQVFADDRVPYDADPRPLQPANKNLNPVREDEGPSPVQDGPHRGTTPATEDAFAYLDTSGEMYSYLGHFRQEKNLEEGHNTGPGVGKKIAHLVHEGKPQKQAVAMALSMDRAGRLTPEGGYRRVGKKK